MIARLSFFLFSSLVIVVKNYNHFLKYSRAITYKFSIHTKKFVQLIKWYHLLLKNENVIDGTRSLIVFTKLPYALLWQCLGRSHFLVQLHLYALVRSAEAFVAVCSLNAAGQMDWHENINSVFSWQMLCTAHNKKISTAPSVWPKPQTACQLLTISLFSVRGVWNLKVSLILWTANKSTPLEEERSS